MKRAKFASVSGSRASTQRLRVGASQSSSRAESAPMALFKEWRETRQLQRKAAQFVDEVTNEPAAPDVSWLAQIATRGDEDHARWELRYARRAIGLLIAQRDALDDRTSSLVARALTEAFEKDEQIDRDRRELAERQFNQRLSAYRDALGARVP